MIIKDDDDDKSKDDMRYGCRSSRFGWAESAMGGIPEFVLWRGRICDRGALGEIHVDAWWVPRIHVLECVHHGIGHHAIGLMA